MRYLAEIKIKYDKNILKCFKPEKLEKNRASYKMKRIKNSIAFEISAADISAFRATINSITQLLMIYEKMAAVAK